VNEIQLASVVAVQAHSVEVAILALRDPPVEPMF
jgi:hypothetical protein